MECLGPLAVRVEWYRRERYNMECFMDPFGVEMMGKHRWDASSALIRHHIIAVDWGLRDFFLI